MFAAGFDGSIRIDSRIDERGFNRGVKSMTATVGKLAAAVAAAFAVQRVVSFGASAVKAASELASAMTGLRSVLDGVGISFSQAQGFIDEFISDGLVPATNAINAYKNLALRGYDTTQIQKTLLALKDAAAFGRQSSLSIGEAVQSASEGLKNENSILVDNAGVTKNVAAMWRDYAAEIGVSVNNLTQQQKIQAEVNGILKETRFQTGDAAKLTQGFSGQVAALGTSFYNLKVAIGNVLIPVLTRVIPLIKAIIDPLVVLFNQLATFMSVLFGVSLATNAVADSASGAADATDDLADATERTEKAARGALAAFDQLDVLQTDKDTPGAPGAPIAPPPIDAEPVEDDLDGVRAKVEVFKEKLLELLGPAIDAFGRLGEAVKPITQELWAGLQWAWENILKPIAEWAITEALPAWLGMVAASMRVLDAIIQAAKPVLKWLWDNFLQPVAEWVGDRFIEAMGWVTDRLNDLADWINNNQETVGKIVAVLLALGAAWVVVSGVMAVFAPIAALVTGAISAIAAVLGFLLSPIGLVVLAIGALVALLVYAISDWESFKKKAGEVWDWIEDKWQGAKDWFKTTVLDPIGARFKNTWETIKKFPENAWNWIKEKWHGARDWFETTVLFPLVQWFDNAWQDIRGFPNTAWQKIKQVWQDASNWFSGTVTTPIRDWFSSAWSDIKGFASDSWESVKRTWQSAADWFSTNVINPIVSAWNTISTAVSTVWSSVKGFVYGAINSIIFFMNDMIYKLVNALNSVIGAYNSVAGWTGLYIMPILAPAPMGPIPYLASGAVIPPNAEFAAILGDQRTGRNIEAPEGLLRQIVREEAGGPGAQDITVRFEGTMGELVRLLKPHIERETRRVGSSLIQGVTR